MFDHKYFFLKVNKIVYFQRPVAIGGQCSKLWVGVCDWPTARPRLVLAISHALRGLHSQKLSAEARAAEKWDQGTRGVCCHGALQTPLSPPCAFVKPA